MSQVYIEQPMKKFPKLLSQTSIFRFSLRLPKNCDKTHKWLFRGCRTSRTIGFGSNSPFGVVIGDVKRFSSNKINPSDSWQRVIREQMVFEWTRAPLPSPSVTHSVILFRRSIIEQQWTMEWIYLSRWPSNSLTHSDWERCVSKT